MSRQGTIGEVADVRVVGESEYRQAHELFLRALLEDPVDDTWWDQTKGRYETGRVLGAYVDGELVGTAMSMRNSLVVPGGERLPAAAVTGVGVRADRTRQGLLTGLMRRQLDDSLARGEVLAMLHASEAVIYERFGYGVASRCQEIEIDRRRARLRATAPRGGRVRLVPPERIPEMLPELYRACRPRRAGVIDRPDAWWPSRLAFLGKSRSLAVHSDESGVPDGYALYEPKESGGWRDLAVYDLWAGNAAAAGELWRFLLGIDLVSKIRAHERALDDPVTSLFDDARASRAVRQGDDLWIRLLDVPAALRGRTYGPGAPVVLQVRDDFLPGNSGSYRITQGSVEPCSAAPDLTVDAAGLAMLYLGDRSVEHLAEAGRIRVHSPAAIPAADHLFGTARPPWCGTGF